MPKPAFRSIALVFALSALVALVGCESPSKVATTDMTPVDTRAPAVTPGAGPSGTAAATASGTSQSGVTAVDLSKSRSADAGAGAAGTALMVAPAQRIVYFDFDSYVIKDEFKGLLDAHAQVLKQAEGKRMVVEGHTDERGSREYNLALGQKRAEAVAKALALLGVSERQIEAVSFGEERPATPGGDEEAWSRSRRAELKDR